MSLPARPHRLLIPLLAAVSGLLEPSPTWSQSVERIVYASVLDRSGHPVTDLTARDFTVRENNIEREVLRVSPATEPFDIAVLVDTSQEAESFIPDFRRSLLEFFQAMANRHEIALIGFGERPTVLVDYTRDTGRLEAGIGRIFAQTGSGAYLMEGIIETSRGLRTRARSRRAIVVIASESQEFSNRDSRDVLDEVRQSGVVLEAFIVAENTLARSSPAE
jgi:Ca-activated chloride channel family protein